MIQSEQMPSLSNVRTSKCSLALIHISSTTVKSNIQVKKNKRENLCAVERISSFWEAVLLYPLCPLLYCSTWSKVLSTLCLDSSSNLFFSFLFCFVFFSFLILLPCSHVGWQIRIGRVKLSAIHTWQGAVKMPFAQCCVPSEKTLLYRGNMSSVYRMWGILRLL